MLVAVAVSNLLRQRLFIFTKWTSRRKTSHEPERNLRSLRKLQRNHTNHLRGVRPSCPSLLWMLESAGGFQHKNGGTQLSDFDESEIYTHPLAKKHAHLPQLQNRIRRRRQRQTIILPNMRQKTQKTPEQPGIQTSVPQQKKQDKTRCKK